MPRRRHLIAVLSALLALSACATGEVPTAEEIKQDNADSRARQFLRVGDATREGGDAVSALAFYERARTQRPDWPEVQARIGETALALGQAELARTAFRHQTDLAPADAGGFLGLGKALILLDRPKEAADAFTRAAALAPKDYRPLNGLGVAQDLLGDPQAAQARYKEALALAPDKASPMNNLGLSLALSGDFEAAIRVLGQAAKDPQGGARARHNLAIALALAGDMDKAAQIARLDLGEAEVKSNLERYAALRAMAPRERARAVHIGIPE